jgi:gliding motility-associated lipoprotein GldD
MTMKYYIASGIFAFLFLMTSCGEESYTPKPRIYPRMTLPETGYQPSDISFCAFRFEQPKTAKIEKKEQYFDGKPLNDCWFTLEYPTLNAGIYFTYAPITAEQPLYKLVEDVYRMEEKHQQKATYIDHLQISRSSAKVYGEVTELGGNVGTPFQFYLTDSSKHFIRAGLTFNAAANADSLAPAVEFIKADMLKIIETIEWE